MPEARPLRLPSLGRLSFKEIARYLLLGCAIYGGSLVLMHGFTDLLGLGELVAYAVVQLLICCTGFLAARRWVFQAHGGHLGRQARRFLASSASFRLPNFALYSVLWSLLSIPREIGILAAIALLLPVKYAVEKTLVFTNRPGGRRRAAQPGLGATPDPRPLWP
jgi:putative flippase GtrA